MSIRIDGTNTAANPGITGADADTGLQFGTDEVNIVTGATSRVTVDSAGRVGIGNTSPTEVLNVNGDIRLEQTLNTTQRIYALRGTGAYALGTSGGAAIALTSLSNQDDEISFETHDQGTSHRLNMRIGPEGYVEKPNQPACAVSLGIGWWDPNAAITFGAMPSNGSFHWNNGGFYAGNTIGGYPYRVLHVPKSGIYMFCLGSYASGSTETRISLYRNNSEQIVFREHRGIGGGDYSNTNIGIQYMDAGDYINMRTEGGAVNSNFYYGNKHTYVQAYFLG